MSTTPVALHLAQCNVATLCEALDHPASAEFVAGLPEVNAAGERAPGYVWRLQTEEGDATAIAAFPNPRTIVNLTVWESPEALHDFAYSGLHRQFLRRRGDWFLPGESKAAMWWVPAGTLPTVDDVRRRLEFVDRFGPSPYAFTSPRGQSTLVVLRRPLDHPDVAPMLARLDHELIVTEPEGGTNFISLGAHEVEGDAGAFFVAYLDGVPRACGAWRRIGPGTGEVKRMWADPDVRGGKLGAAVLDTIAGSARAAGCTELKLETGLHLTAAVALYRKYGFGECEPWGEYVGVLHSHCMRLPLTRT